MGTRRLYHREPRYKDMARNEAADMQSRIASLTLWISDHPLVDSALRDLFNKKIDIMLQFHDVCTEIINYKKSE